MGLFDTHFVQFGQVLVTNFRVEIVSYTEIVSYKYPISGKITTVPRLFSEHLHQMKNKHQIMNVHTKWEFDTHLARNKKQEKVIHLITV